MAKGKFTSQIRPGDLAFGICMRDAMGRYRVLACAATLKLAQAIASAMANDPDWAKFDSPAHRPILYVIDVKGIMYGSY